MMCCEAVGGICLMSFEYWDKVYSAKDVKYAKYDGWLNKYQPIVEIAGNIIDLGSGCGVNSIFLNEHNINALICDFSEVALALVESAIPGAHTMCFNMKDGLPYEVFWAGVKRTAQRAGENHS